MILQKDLNGEGMARALMKYMDNRSELTKMGEQARKISRTNAAKIIVDQMVEMVVSA